MSTYDTSGTEVGDPKPADWRDDRQCCDAANYGYLCTAPAGHTGPHVATDDVDVQWVWS